MEFRLNTRQLERAIRQAPQAIDRASAIALRDIKNDWQADSVDIAPLDQNALRTSIHADVINPSVEGRVEIYASAKRDGFDYAYYIHEKDGKAVTGEKKFLDVPAEQNFDKWKRWIEQEMREELRRAGW